MSLTPVITEHWDDPELYTIAGYQRYGGYRALYRKPGAVEAPVVEVRPMIAPNVQIKSAPAPAPSFWPPAGQRPPETA